MKTVVIIPTYKNFNYIKAMYEHCVSTVPDGVKVIPICMNQSAAKNRNYGIRQANIGDIIVSLDDDISGFYHGWIDDITKPLEERNVLMVSARLLHQNGTPHPMQGDQGDDKSDYFVAEGNRVPSAAVAWVHEGIYFDENYIGAGYEDTDFCQQLFKARPDGKILIANKCKLVHRNETKHENGDPPNKIYYHSKWDSYFGMDVCIFSKDRALQLDLLLRSIEEYMPEVVKPMHVLYKASTPQHEEAYQDLFAAHRNVIPNNIEPLSGEVKRIIQDSHEPWFMFMSDDEVVIKNVGIKDFLPLVTNDVMSISLRLGKSVDYCQPAGKKMQLPSFYEFPIMKWDWTVCDQFTDWGYPHSICGTVHRTALLQQYCDIFQFNTVNELELAMGNMKQCGKPHMISLGQCVVNVPHNRVSESNTPNMGGSTDDLLVAYNMGDRIAIEPLETIPDAHSCFVEAPYVMKRQIIGVHFNPYPPDAKITGCLKVTMNTLRGLNMAGLPYSERLIERHNGVMHMMPDMNMYPLNSAMGVEIAVYVDDVIDLWRQYRTWITPCRWVTDMYRSHPASGGHNVWEWPCGIDTEAFNDNQRSKSPRWDALIYYKTVTGQNIDQGVADIRKWCDDRGLSHITIKYGDYNESYFKEIINDSRFAIWYAGTESQNVALLEVMAMGLPVYVIDMQWFQYAGRVWENPRWFTSAPYFDGRCGIKHPNMLQFDNFLDNLSAYCPRDYVVSEFNLVKCAQNYYNIVLRS